MTLISSSNQKPADHTVKLECPPYDPLVHYLDLTNSEYYRTLIKVRHNLKIGIDQYFNNLGGFNVDLFMLTPSISSPFGPGSDSEAIPIKFGKYDSYLVDSSQFGFEPLILNNLDLVYCYLPSMRGEDPDKRHLNQFYHCEAEIKGDLNTLRVLIEEFLIHLFELFENMQGLLLPLSKNPEQTLQAIQRIGKLKQFEVIEFDQAVEILINNGFKDMINFTDKGRDIKSQGEIELMKILNTKNPIWLRGFDRDRVPFYQKPDSNNPDRVLNLDLLFPPLIENSFGGEIVGAGQRQDTTKQMYESLERQSLSSQNYEWYINLRNQPNYSTTSGFGLGVERLLTWLLCRDNIAETIIYPRLKNFRTLP